jgi:hypothetical protein|tara:strand:+ start:507 stop:1049 length:543 start_codon:yes stop_codon:yes gene_type:complete
MEMLISEEYKKKIQEKHQQHKKWGGAVIAKGPKIDFIAKISNSKSILDYGSGKNSFEKEIKSMYDIVPYSIHNYEPGIEELSGDPPCCDMTICIDVMEHVEPECVDAVFKHIFNKTNKIVMFNISCVPAGGAFANGDNLHLTVRPPLWWLDKARKHGFEIIESISGIKHVEFIAKPVGSA